MLFHAILPPLSIRTAPQLGIISTLLVDDKSELSPLPLCQMGALSHDVNVCILCKQVCHMGLADVCRVKLAYQCANDRHHQTHIVPI